MMIEPSAYYEIEFIELAHWQNDSKVLSDIGSGNLIVNDGASDITDVASAINHLKAVDTTQRDSDGAILSRVKVTQTGWNYQLVAVEIETSKQNGAYCKDHDGNAVTWFTHKMYDANGAETQTELDAVKTVVDFEPPFDYEILGGTLRQKSVPDSDMYYSVIGVPDVPANYGGSKVFVQAVDLTFIGTGTELKADGRAPKRLIYSPIYHTNKLRFQILHEAGKQHKFLQCLEFFRP
jgi:hypothetical protein